MQITEQIRTTLSDRADRLKAELLLANDILAAGKVDELMLRAQHPAQLAALVGLFSAGKSTLINALCQSELATGAVPTTAKIDEISLPGTDDSVYLLDTPGVDSTDAAHRLATEDALYKADVVLLVMDYQHVEAEENLELASGFAAGAKRLALVINQVDKHLDFELPFADFQVRIESTLQDWDISYERIFYTATKPSPYSQLAELKAWLTGLAQDAEVALNAEVAATSTSNSDPSADTPSPALDQRLREVIRDSVKRRFSPQQDEVVEAAACAFPRDLLGDERSRNQVLESLLAEHVNLQQTLASSKQALDEQCDELQTRFSRMASLAQIAPYDTTERGRHYVESLRDSFRIGWLGGKSKTETERNRRQSEFLTDLNEHTERFLCWSVQGELRSAIQDNEWLPNDWLSAVDHLSVSVTPELCTGVLNRGAIESEQYPYQYVKDVVARVKGQFSSRLSEFLSGMFAAATSQWQEAHTDSSKRLDALDEQISLLQAFVTLAHIQSSEIERLEAVWEDLD